MASVLVRKITLNLSVGDRQKDIVTTVHETKAKLKMLYILL